MEHFSCEFEAESYEDAKQVVRKWSDAGIIPPGRYGIGHITDNLYTNRYYAYLIG